MKLPLILFAGLLSLAIAYGKGKVADGLEKSRDANGNVKVLIAYKEAIDDKNAKKVLDIRGMVKKVHAATGIMEAVVITSIREPGPPACSTTWRRMPSSKKLRLLR